MRTPLNGLTYRNAFLHRTIERCYMPALSAVAELLVLIQIGISVCQKKNTRNSPGDEIANVPFLTTTLYTH